MKRRLGSVVTRGGVTLPFIEQGRPAGIPVILLHGYTDSWRSFEPLLPHLPESLHVFALTQRGHGDADRPATGYGARDFSADLAAFMDALGIERAVIVGHSMGSQVAQRFAIDHPKRVLALGLVGAFSTLRDNPVVQGLWDSIVSTLENPVDPAFVRDFQESTVASPVPRALLDAIVAESLKVPARVWRAALHGQMRTDLSGDLGKIKAPTFILWGDRDGICSRAEQERLATSIRGARLSIYAGVGHAVHWEQPRRVAADLRAFVDSVVMAGALAD